VLVEAQLATRPDHASQLGQGRVSIGHAAEQSGRDAGVERRIGRRQGVGHARLDSHGVRRVAGCSLRHRAQMRLGLDCQDLGDGGRIVAEVNTAPRADFDHTPAQPGK
jgi:hypothetical protein